MEIAGSEGTAMGETDDEACCNAGLLAVANGIEGDVTIADIEEYFTANPTIAATCAAVMPMPTTTAYAYDPALMQCTAYDLSAMPAVGSVTTITDCCTAGTALQTYYMGETNDLLAACANTVTYAWDPATEVCTKTTQLLDDMMMPTGAPIDEVVDRSECCAELQRQVDAGDFGDTLESV